MEVSDQIIKVLDNLGQKFGIAVDWTQSNIMPYIQQLGQRIVNYELWTSVVWLILMIIMFIISIFVLKKSIKNVSSYDEGKYVPSVFGIIFSIVGLIVSIFVMVSQTLDIVTCLTLPEKVIFEFVRQYIH
jgi:uncharacterized protein YacL